MDKRKNIIAEGEATGHAHRAVGRNVVVDDNKTVDAPDGAEITHEEHGDFEIPPGRYRTGQVREVDHVQEQVRTVID